MELLIHLATILEVITIASSNEFKSFYESEIDVRELEIENQKLKAKKEGYLKIYDQMVAKARKCRWNDC